MSERRYPLFPLSRLNAADRKSAPVLRRQPAPASDEEQDHTLAVACWNARKLRIDWCEGHIDPDTRVSKVLIVSTDSAGQFNVAADSDLLTYDPQDAKFAYHEAAATCHHWLPVVRPEMPLPGRTDKIDPAKFRWGYLVGMLAAAGSIDEPLQEVTIGSRTGAQKWFLDLIWPQLDRIYPGIDRTRGYFADLEKRLREYNWHPTLPEAGFLSSRLRKAAKGSVPAKILQQGSRATLLGVLAGLLDHSGACRFTSPSRTTSKNGQAKAEKQLAPPKPYRRVVVEEGYRTARLGDLHYLCHRLGIGYTTALNASRHRGWLERRGVLDCDAVVAALLRVKDLLPETQLAKWLTSIASKRPRRSRSSAPADVVPFSRAVSEHFLRVTKEHETGRLSECVRRAAEVGHIDRPSAELVAEEIGRWAAPHPPSREVKHWRRLVRCREVLWTRVTQTNEQTLRIGYPIMRRLEHKNVITNSGLIVSAENAEESEEEESEDDDMQAMVGTVNKPPGTQVADPAWPRSPKSMTLTQAVPMRITQGKRVTLEFRMLTPKPDVTLEVCSLDDSTGRLAWTEATLAPQPHIGDLLRISTRRGGQFDVASGSRMLAYVPGQGTVLATEAAELSGCWVAVVRRTGSPLLQSRPHTDNYRWGYLLGHLIARGRVEGYEMLCKFPEASRWREWFPDLVESQLKKMYPGMARQPKQLRTIQEQLEQPRGRYPQLPERGLSETIQEVLDRRIPARLLAKCQLSVHAGILAGFLDAAGLHGPASDQATDSPAGSPDSAQAASAAGGRRRSGRTKPLQRIEFDDLPQGQLRTLRAVCRRLGIRGCERLGKIRSHGQKKVHLSLNVDDVTSALLWGSNAMPDTPLARMLSRIDPDLLANVGRSDSSDVLPIPAKALRHFCRATGQRRTSKLATTVELCRTRGCANRAVARVIAEEIRCNASEYPLPPSVADWVRPALNDDLYWVPVTCVISQGHRLACPQIQEGPRNYVTNGGLIAVSEPLAGESR